MMIRPTSDHTELITRLGGLRPRTPDELHRLIGVLLGLEVPRAPVLEGNDSPFDYLSAAYFLDHHPPGQDLLVWANRGGGKTSLAAAATLMDLLFKPGIQIRILAGSLAQASCMYGHLLSYLSRPGLGCLLESNPTQRRLQLINGSAVELLSQSAYSVRGQRVHKVRCDEVELFNPDVWNAAQLVTQSGHCGPYYVHGTIEAISTMHLPFGLMSRLVSRAGGKPVGDAVNVRVSETTPRSAMRLLRWSALDVAQRCPPERPCEPCPIRHDCRGRAKEATGFIPIDDLIRQWSRTGHETWSAEMMCRQPTRSHRVYPGFDALPGSGHVLPADSALVTDAIQQAQAPDATQRTARVLAGIDFGLRSPFVFLWALLIPKGGVPAGETDADPLLVVFDEYCVAGLTLEQHLDAVESRGHPNPAWAGIDPAGAQRNAHTGLSDIDVLHHRGYQPRWQQSTIRHGVELIRRRLDHRTLAVTANCEQLIRALSTYHFDTNHPERDQPVKDGPDHLCDALRYLVINLSSGASPLSTRNYLTP